MKKDERREKRIAFLKTTIHDEFIKRHPELKNKSLEEINAYIKVESETREIARRQRLKAHLEVFSDAVIAIILTIIVLEIPIPNHGETYQQVLSSIAIFLISFFIVSDFWLDNHHLFDGVETITERILVADFVFLALLSLIPLFSKWMMVEVTGFSVINYGILYMLLLLVQNGLKFLIHQEENKEHQMTGQIYRVIVWRHTIALLLVNSLVMIFGYFHPMIAHYWYAATPILSFVLASRQNTKRRTDEQELLSKINW
jgi:uncharacterized membrane protein